MVPCHDRAVITTDMQVIDHSGWGISQWETTLHRNVVSHWLSPYPEWSLYIYIYIYITWIHNELLKRKCCYFDKMFAIGFNRSCQNIILLCSKWCKCRQHAGTSDSVHMGISQLCFSRQGSTSSYLALQAIPQLFLDTAKPKPLAVFSSRPYFNKTSYFFDIHLSPFIFLFLAKLHITHMAPIIRFL